MKGTVELDVSCILAMKTFDAKDASNIKDACLSSLEVAGAS